MYPVPVQRRRGCRRSALLRMHCIQSFTLPELGNACKLLILITLVELRDWHANCLLDERMAFAIGLVFPLLTTRSGTVVKLTKPYRASGADLS